jgi:hypothetical protein
VDTAVISSCSHHILTFRTITVRSFDNRQTIGICAGLIEPDVLN